MPHFDDAIFRAIPTPALIAAEGRVVAFNPAAAQLFPNLTYNGPIPQPLSLPHTEAGLVMAEGRAWHFSASDTEQGTLLLLQPARLEGLSQGQLDGTVRRLREQLAQLLLSVQLMSRAETPAPELSAMQHVLCQTLRLTGQLDLMRELDDNNVPFRPVLLDLAGLCREVTAAAASLLELSGIQLEFESRLSSLLVRGDSDLLQKLLLELISNAARAAGKGGRVQVSLAQRGQQAVLTFTGDCRQDDGRPLAQLLTGSHSEDRIPMPGEGAGLGLTVAQRIVGLHGGTLVMERQKGIVVTVSLPAAKHGPPLVVGAPKPDYSGGFSAELVALSDLLPDQAFARLDVE